MPTTQRIVEPSPVKLLVVAVLALSSAAQAQSADPRRVLADIPGLDFTRLAPPAQKELAAVFTDEFDYCGKPLTVAAALKKPDACKHTRRLAVYAAGSASEGEASTEIINQLSRYNESFKLKRVAFKPDERQCKGPKDAKVTVVEFSDFECPYCNAARPLVEQLLKRGDVRVCWQPFPLSQHPAAMPAATAALLARDAGKFWAMHDALFDHQLSLNEQSIAGLVKGLGLDEKAFAKAYAEKKYDAEITASKELGKQGNVDATPSFFFNGRKLTFHPSADSLALSLDDELDWVGNKNGWASN